MNKFLGLTAFSLLFSQVSMALIFDDIKPVQYKFTEITAKYKSQPLLAYTVNEWSDCIRESDPGYGNRVGVFKKVCDVLLNHAQPKVDKLCQKFGFDKAAKVNRLWLNTLNPYFDYSTHMLDKQPTVAHLEDGSDSKPISSFPSLLTLDAYGEFVQVKVTDMMSKSSFGTDRYSSKSLASRTPKATVEAMGPTSATFRIVICGTRN